MYRLIALDLDGTLLNEEKRITIRAKNAIAEARKKGAYVVLASGRPLIGIQPYLSELDLTGPQNYAISFNGALVQETYSKKSIVHLTLTMEDAARAFAVSKEFGVHMHFFDSELLYTPNRDIGFYTVYEAYQTGAPLAYRAVEEIDPATLVSKIMFIDPPEILNKLADHIPPDLSEKYYLVKSTPFFLEMLHPKASKGMAVTALADHLGIPMEEVICIGDEANDSTMIEAAGLGVAMGNAVPAIREIADMITGTNEEDGVAQVIERYVLNTKK